MSATHTHTMWHVNPLPDMQGCPARQRTSGSVITFNCMNTAVCRRASWARSVPKPPPEPHKATGLPCIGAGPSTRGLEAQSSAFCNNTAPTKRCQMGFMRCGGCVRSNEPSWVRSWSSYLRATHTERAVSHARKMACGRASRQPRRPRTYTQERQGCTRLRHGGPCGNSTRFPGRHQRCTGLEQPCLSMKQEPPLVQRAARTFIEQRQVHIDEREGFEIVTRFDKLGHGAQQPCVGARFPNRTTEGDNLQQTISLRAAAEPAAKPARTSTASHLQACRLALRCHGRWGVYVVRFSWRGCE